MRGMLTSFGSCWMGVRGIIEGFLSLCLLVGGCVPGMFAGAPAPSLGRFPADPTLSRFSYVLWDAVAGRP
jgi:hypothetical protein